MYYDVLATHHGSRSEIIQVTGAADGLCYAAKSFYLPVNSCDQAEMAKWKDKIKEQYDVLRKAGMHLSVCWRVQQV